MTAPRVALLHVTAKREHAPAYQRLADRLNRSALATVESLGWSAVLHASADAPVRSAVELARESDLVVLLGGEDVHPDFYGGARDYQGGGRHEPAADEAQLAVARDAIERGTPVLGICRGHQLLNVAFGGDLIQHLAGTGRHRDNSAGAAEPFTRHAVALAPGGLLGGAVRPNEIVHSSHHQAAGRLGSGLRVAAQSDDGVVEAVAHETLPVIGVQWHPEHHGAPDDQFGRLLRHLHARAA